MKLLESLDLMPRNIWRTRRRMNFPIDGLVLYLPLWHPELSGATIVSKDLNALSCAVTGAVHTPPLGRTFDAVDDRIAIPNFATILNLNRNFWFGVWVKVLGKSGSQYPSIINNGDSGFTIALDSENKTFFVGHSGIALLPGTTAFDYDIWYHLFGGVGTGATAPYYLYVKGELKISGTTNLDFVASGNTMIGKDSTSGGSNTRIGECCMYNRVLTASEIEHIYNATKWRYV